MVREALSASQNHHLKLTGRDKQQVKQQQQHETSKYMEGNNDEALCIDLGRRVIRQPTSTTETNPAYVVTCTLEQH
jgi:hypothetical protein